MMTKASTTAGALARVRAHEFHPLDEDDFTIDRALHRHGIADPDDSDWLVRLLAIRDLVRAPDAEISTIVDGLFDAEVSARPTSRCRTWTTNHGDWRRASAGSGWFSSGSSPTGAPCAMASSPNSWTSARTSSTPTSPSPP